MTENVEAGLVFENVQAAQHGSARDNAAACDACEIGESSVVERSCPREACESWKVGNQHLQPGIPRED